MLQCLDVARAALGEPLKREGAELLYRCPHPNRHTNGDAHPSLKINAQKNTWGCFVCGVTGTAWSLAAFLAGVEPSDKPIVRAWLCEHGLSSGKGATKATNGRGPCVAHYVYREANANPVARKLRYEPGRDGRKKDFAWERWENGAWVGGLGGTETPLYRLPEIASESFVVLTEGEKDADAGAGLGLATTTSGGTGTFRPDHAEALSGKDVAIVAHSDDPGRQDSQRVAVMLYGKAACVKVCEIPASKDLAEAIEKGVPINVLLALFEETRAWKPAEGCEVLNSVLQFVRRFVALSENQGRVVSSWIAHTHAIDAAEFTPYLNINSAEKESGKTRLLEVDKVLVANPWKTENASAPALIRKIHSDSPTVLLDERDSFFAGDKERTETLRGILNSGMSVGVLMPAVSAKGRKWPSTISTLLEQRHWRELAELATRLQAAAFRSASSGQGAATSKSSVNAKLSARPVRLKLGSQHGAPRTLRNCATHGPIFRPNSPTARRIAASRYLPSPIWLEATGPKLLDAR